MGEMDHQVETERKLLRWAVPVVTAALVLLVLALVAPQSARAEIFNLQSVKAQVERDYKGVAHMETAELAKLLQSGENILLFDVREEQEYRVSHIPGAIRVSPSIWGWSFLRQYGERVKGKKIVFYCSVGVRSSILAERTQQGLRKPGALQVKNLIGGIFAWHNEKRPLVNAKGPTPYVHPYDSHWGKLIDHKEHVRMKPAG